MNIITHTEIWKSLGDLGLVGDLALEWNNYTTGLEQAGVTSNKLKRTNYYGMEATHQVKSRLETATRLFYLYFPYQTFTDGNSNFGSGTCN
jgi:hypothetical protein